MGILRFLLEQSMKQAYDLGASVRVTDNGNTALYLVRGGGGVIVQKPIQ